MYLCFLSAAFFMINVPFIHLDFNLISQQLESIKSGGDVEAWRTGSRLLLLLSFIIVFVYALRKACSIITQRLCSTTSSCVVSSETPHDSKRTKGKPLMVCLPHAETWSLSFPTFVTRSKCPSWRNKTYRTTLGAVMFLHRDS